MTLKRGLAAGYYVTYKELTIGVEDVAKVLLDLKRRLDYDSVIVIADGADCSKVRVSITYRRLQ